MRTYLLTWNPNDDKGFNSILLEQTPKTLAGERFQSKWSTGNRKQMEAGSRIFLVRLGKEPKGIIGSARTVSIPELAPHRDSAKRLQGKKSIFVRCEWDALISTELYKPLSVEALHKAGLHTFDWTPESSGIKMSEEVADMLEQLWAKHLAEISDTTYDSISVGGYIKALKTLPDRYREILVLQFQCPRHEVSAGQLAESLGYRHHLQGNQFYGRAGHLVCDALNVAKPAHGQWWAALSKGYQASEVFVWIMRPNLVEAIKQLGWAREQQYQTFFTSPDEQATIEEFAEGRVQLVAVNIFERSAKARLACLHHYGFVCAACGFDFEKYYGELGREFIHCHHIKPLAEIGEEYTVDPIKDLRPVCPNCHAMLHRQTPALTVSQLTDLIESLRASASLR